jgi:regulator of sirC expression with transglutaminase-like and TPR domain
MSENKEISALLQLIDDPDQEVFETVAAKILHYGSVIIPNLENLWEETPDEDVQERIELLIHRVHYQDLQADFKLWSKEEDPDILPGALLVARYRFPGLSSDNILYEIDKIKRNIWLELNNYLTPLEQMNVLNSMIYSYFGMKGTEISYGRPNHFFINHVVETRKGNAISIGILYQTLCKQLDIPVCAVNIPKQFILGYFNEPLEFTADALPDQGIQFFIDPLQGQIYTLKDVETYLKRMDIPFEESFLYPAESKAVIRILLKELAKCYENEKEGSRCDELMNLADILKD